MNTHLEHCVAHNGLNHVGLTVTSIPATLAWYERVFGVEPKFVQQAGEGEALDAAMELSGVSLTYAFVELGNTCIEFLEFQRPDGDARARKNNDIGSVHVCFEVDDVNTAYENVLALGLTTNAAPVKIGEGPLVGWTFCYFRDPDGIQLEVISAP